MAPTLPPMPNPNDPANDWWWEAYDCLDTIAIHAQAIYSAARVAQDRWRGGDDPQLQPLAEQLHRWIWTPASLDIITTATPRQANQGGVR